MDPITTSLPEKLPEPIRALFVETQPLPPDAVFFEQRFTLATVTQRLILGLVLLALGVLLVPVGVITLFTPERNATVYTNHDLEWWFIGAGAVMGLAGWTMVASVPASLALGRQQKAGVRTRYGIFLIPEALVWRSFFDTTVIPRASFRGLENRRARYASANGEKSYALPTDWINVAPAEPEAAIRSWSQSATPAQLPPVSTPSPIESPMPSDP